jgi:hypothetical protein
VGAANLVKAAKVPENVGISERVLGVVVVRERVGARLATSSGASCSFLVDLEQDDEKGQGGETGTEWTALSKTLKLLKGVPGRGRSAEPASIGLVVEEVKERQEAAEGVMSVEFVADGLARTATSQHQQAETKKFAVSGNDPRIAVLDDLVNQQMLLLPFTVDHLGGIGPLAHRLLFGSDPTRAPTLPRLHTRPAVLVFISTTWLTAHSPQPISSNALTTIGLPSTHSNDTDPLITPAYLVTGVNNFLALTLLPYLLTTSKLASLASLPTTATPACLPPLAATSTTPLAPSLLDGLLQVAFALCGRPPTCSSWDF